MPTPPRSQRSLYRSAGIVPAQSRQREANESDSSTTERSARDATRWVHGRDRQTRTQPGGEVSDQFGLSSGVGQPRTRSGAGLSPRLLPVLGDMRSIAPILPVLAVAKPRGLWCFVFLGAHDAFDCLGCLRPSKRRSVSQAWSRCCSGGMQGWSDWSGAGAKLASQSSCAGGTVPMLGASGVVRRLRLAATKRKCRLGDAGVRAGLAPFPQRGAKRRGFDA